MRHTDSGLSTYRLSGDEHPAYVPLWMWDLYLYLTYLLCCLLQFGISSLFDVIYLGAYTGSLVLRRLNLFHCS